MDVQDPIRSKSSEIQLLKSNWIWILLNPIPRILGSPLNDNNQRNEHAICKTVIPSIEES
jgi:hypothetical protein